MPKLGPPPTVDIDCCVIRENASTSCIVLSGPRISQCKRVSFEFTGFSLIFGFALLMEPDDIVPQLIIDDFGRQYPGAAGLSFALKDGDAFPGADVMGTRLSTGRSDHLFMKHLDLARGLRCFGRSSTRPDDWFKVDKFIWVDDQLDEPQILSRQDARVPMLVGLSCKCLVGSWNIFQTMTTHKDLSETNDDDTGS